MVTDQDIRAMQIKQVRRQLLTVLKMFYPASASYETLRLTLPQVEDSHLRKDLSYLCAKDYVKWENAGPNMGWEEREFVLTATGVETADRINRDTALEV